jgi:large subunit ribosomal protein L23
MNTPTSLPLVPRISEKTYAASQKGTYVFDVPMGANKSQVKLAVETQFKVGVSSVRSQVRKGKSKSSARRRTRPVDGVRTDTKQMFVSLNKGETLPLFEELN